MKQDELLHFYQEELAFLRQLSEKFAQAHPKIAGRLRLSPNNIEDPHVARLIEAVALSNARVRQKLEDEFPEISDALLQILHPNALSPIPSMAVCQFQKNQQQLAMPKLIPANSELHSDPVNGQICQFTTRYPVQLVPLEPTEAKLASKPITAPVVTSANDCSAVLRLCLACTHHATDFSKLEINELRFFINAPSQYAHTLYSLLFQHTAAIAIADSINDSTPIVLDPKDCLQPVGFKPDESMLPYNKRIFMGYRLITEYFAFPEKFLFFDLLNIGTAVAQKLTTNNPQFEIYFYLNQSNPLLEKKIAANFFALSCTPIVNLFDKEAEPILLTNTQAEYNVIPNVRHLPESTEIYSINHVTTSSFNGSKIDFLPFYGLKHNQNIPYYHVVRKPSWEAGHYPLRGTEVFLAFSDRELNRFTPEKWVIHAEITCTNRDLPEQLTLNGNTQSLKLHPNMATYLDKITCLTPMTPVRRPASQQAARWRYVSHLALNHLSLTGDENGIESLRGILKLYDFDQTDEHTNTLEGLLAIHSRPTYVRSPSGHRGNPFWYGSEIILVVDETKFSNGNLFLLGCVLNHFFSLYTSINLFIQLVIKNWQHELFRFSPRTGDRPVL